MAKKWSIVPWTDPNGNLPSREFQYTGKDAYDAIMAVTQAPFVGECEGTAELAILYATAQVMATDKDAFNQLFHNRLIFGVQETQTQLSVMQLLPSHQQLYYYGTPPVNITTRDMVPGDWVYMKNADYGQQDHAGPWVGENAIYMGEYDKILNGQVSCIGSYANSSLY